MLDRNGLKAAIMKSGSTQCEVAHMLGIAPKTFYEKMKKGSFGTDEAKKMIDFLCIENPVDIFFANEVTY